MSNFFGKLLQRVGFKPQHLLTQGLKGKTKAKVKKPKKPEKQMIDPMELVTGLQKRELLAYQAGCNDPFHTMKIVKRGPGTKEAPNMVPSAFEGRIVGCLCQDNRFAQWMWLERGCPKRCECGYWFQIQEVERF